MLSVALLTANTNYNYSVKLSYRIIHHILYSISHFPESMYKNIENDIFSILNETKENIASSLQIYIYGNPLAVFHSW